MYNVCVCVCSNIPTVTHTQQAHDVWLYKLQHKAHKQLKHMQCYMCTQSMCSHSDIEIYVCKQNHYSLSHL